MHLEEVNEAVKVATFDGSLIDLGSPEPKQVEQKDPFSFVGSQNQVLDPV